MALHCISLVPFFIHLFLLHASYPTNSTMFGCLSWLVKRISARNALAFASFTSSIVLIAMSLSPRQEPRNTSYKAVSER